MTVTRRIYASVIAILLMSASALAQTGSPKSTADLNAEVFGLFPDNTIHLITPYNARQMFLDIIASATGGGGGVSSVNGSDGSLVFSPTSGAVIGSCATASVVQLGCIKPDGTSITISGQVISAPGSGGGGTVVLASNSSGSSIVQGAPVYVSGAGAMAPARANGFSTAGVLGIANALVAPSATGGVVVTGPLVLTTAEWDAVVTGESGGLTSGTLYFLDSAAAGKLTATAPSTPGQVVTLIGRALSPTTLIIMIAPPLLL